MDLYNLVVSAKLTKGGGGGDIEVDALSVTENGTYTAEEGHAYSPVTVDVPNSYSASDEGKVVSNGALVGQTSATKTANGTYDTTFNDEVVVNVPGPSGTKSITENGTYDVTDFASANVNVSGGGGGDHDAEDAIIMGTLSGAYTNSRVTTLKQYAFYKGFSSLTALILPNLTELASGCIGYCEALKEVHLENLAGSLPIYAIQGCSNLEVVDMPNVVSFHSMAMYNNPKVKTFIAPKAKTIPSAMYTPWSSTLEYWEAATGFYQGAHPSTLRTAVFWSVSNIRTMANMPYLSCVKMHDASQIGYTGGVFSGCSQLMEVYMFNTSGNITSGVANMFTSTPMGDSSYTGSFGSIYVPASLVSDYKAADYWSVYADRITAYEGE